jgi:peptide deformylase
MLERILLLGNPLLYEISKPVQKEEIEEVKKITGELHAALMEFREKYKAGRAIAAPQLGYLKRIIYMHIDKPVVFINPVLINKSEKMMELWDDCMSFPGLLVKVQRHEKCSIKYTGLDWQENVMDLEGSLSELLQHEYDHLDGILATMRIIDNKSLKLIGE